MSGFLAGFTQGLGDTAKQYNQNFMDMQMRKYSNAAKIWESLAADQSYHPNIRQAFAQKAQTLASTNIFDKNSRATSEGILKENPHDAVQEAIRAMDATGQHMPSYYGQSGTKDPIELERQTELARYGAQKTAQINFLNQLQGNNTPDTTAQYGPPDSELNKVLQNDQRYRDAGITSHPWVEPKTVTMSDAGGAPQTYWEHKGRFYNMGTGSHMQFKGPTVQTTLFRQPTETQSTTSQSIDLKTGAKVTTKHARAGGRLNPGATPPPPSTSPPNEVPPPPAATPPVTPSGTKIIQTTADLEALKRSTDPLDQHLYGVLDNPRSWKGLPAQVKLQLGPKLAAHGFNPNGPQDVSPTQLGEDSTARKGLIALNEVSGILKDYPLSGVVAGRLITAANKVGSSHLVKGIAGMLGITPINVIPEPSHDELKQEAIRAGAKDPDAVAKAAGFLITRMRFLNLAEVRAIIGRAQGVATMYNTFAPALMGLQQDPALLQGHMNAFRSALTDSINETDRLVWGNAGPYPPHTRALQSLLEGKPIIQQDQRTTKFRWSWDGGKTWQQGPLPPSP